ncbi:MAG: branched-chain amino acid ABC transporter permease [Betaproteobacteria bacterium RIFCSPLOWO2_12_FULL_62_13b]|nr:MAG: branched-chain amino acid ABC transporter permease [Betaproteobacteria bacterium RIFCSPLOWO2_12_FULL_62_13b]
MDLMLGQVLISGILLGGIYALISMGLTLIFGVTRIVNFAHGEFMMLSMFAASVLSQQYGLDPYVAVIPIAALAFLAGAATQRIIIQPLLNASHASQIFVTMGLSITLMNVALMVWGADFQSVRTPYEAVVLPLGPWSVGVPRLVTFLVAVAMMVGLMLFLNRTYMGKAITAVSQDRMAALLMGIDVNRVYVVAFGIGIACVGVAGAVLTPIYSVFPTVGQYFALTAYVVVVLGGFGSMVGAMVGGMSIGVVEALSGYFISPGLKEAVYLLIFIAVLVIRPSGLFGIVGAEEMGVK